MGAPGPEEQYFQEQERRENERTQREVAREREERENRAREEQREAAREKADEAHRVGERNLGRVHAPEGYGFSAGGGPSFILNITEGLTVPSETAKVEPANGGFASLTFNPGLVNLMKDKSVAPGSVWEIFGIYLKLVPRIFSTLSNLEPPGNSSALMALTATMYRNTHPIWIATGSVQPHAAVSAKQEVTNYTISAGGQALALGVEFNSPVVIGPGENLSLELSYEGQMAWENSKTNFLFMTMFTTVPGIGSIRYNIRPIGKGTP